jgi:tetratricopeptide (TPR) repeat protein
MSKKTQILLIIFAGLLFYYNSLFNGFVWDDEFLVKDNIHIRSMGSATRYAFSNDIFPGDTPDNKTSYYRPLQLISYAIDYFFWQDNPFGFHLTNLLIHILTAIFAYLILLNLGASSILAILSALFFVVHPIQHSAVSYISGRADPLAALFVLGSFYFFIKFRQGNKYTAFALSALFFFLALLSKEYALASPLLFFVFDFCFNRFKKEYIYQYVLFIITVIIYLILRINALGFSNSLRVPSLFIQEFPLRLYTFIKSIPFYLQLLIWPENLHMERALVKPTSFFDPWVFITTVSLLTGFVFLSRGKERRRLFLFFSIFFLILIFSQSNIILTNISFSEHFLYLASLSIFYYVAYIFSRLFIFWRIDAAKQRLLIIICCGLVLFFGILTSTYNINWKNNISFYRWTLKYFPASARLRINLGNEYLFLGNYELALNQYYKSRELLSKISLKYYPDKSILEGKLNERIKMTHYNLGVLYFQKGELPRAGNHYISALTIDQNFHLARNDLAALLAKIGEAEEAIRQLNIILKLDPENMQAYYNLGVIYVNRAQPDKAKKIWLRGLSIEPTDKKIRAHLDNLKTNNDKN